MWAIGDVQGCFKELKTLVDLIDQTTPSAPLWFAGDLVNRGPESLATLRYIKALGPRAVCVLGNHDLHLLALAAGVRQAKPGDTMVEILAAPDATQLLDWLRCQPLAVLDKNYLLVHAGLFPAWSPRTALELAGAVERQLRGSKWQDTIRDMYGNQPTAWGMAGQALSATERLRFTVNALTRMRYLKKTSDTSIELDLSSKESALQAPAGLTPWYLDARIQQSDTTVVYGHWSTQGLQLHPRSIGLDTGCVWGGSLSAVELTTRRFLQVKGRAYQAPG
jgi:bis(5'-nucleosyl)-tetraphosphatase (symmetrical)